LDEVGKSGSRSLTEEDATGSGGDAGEGEVLVTIWVGAREPTRAVELSESSSEDRESAAGGAETGGAKGCSELWARIEGEGVGTEEESIVG
jgi:hypothetical protein